MSEFNTNEEKYKIAQEAKNETKELLTSAQDGNIDKLNKFIHNYMNNNSDIIKEEILNNFHDANGRSVLHFASIYGHLDYINHIIHDIYNNDLSHVNLINLLNEQDDEGATPLILACKTGQIHIINKLIELNVDIFKTMKNGSTILHHAVSSDDPDLIALLIDNDKNNILLEKQSGSGTPLHWAAGEGLELALETLIEKGANVNALNQQNINPLIMAAANGSSNCIVKLIKDGNANPKGVILPGNLTLLHICSDLGLEDAVISILETENGRECLFIEKDDNNYKPIDLAAISGHRNIIEILYNKMNNISNKNDIENYNDIIDNILNKGIEQKNNYINNIENNNKKEEEENKNNINNNTIDELIQEYNLESINSPNSNEDIEKAKEWKTKGNNLFRLKKYNEALNAYTKAIELHGNNHIYWSNRSVCYIELKDPNRALADARICRQINPTWPKACYRMAVARLKLNLYEDAALAAFEGLKLDEHNEELKKLLQKAVKLGRKEHFNNQI